MPAKISVTLKGILYVWNGSLWYDSKTFLQPPDLIITKLNEIRDIKWRRQDALSDVLSLITEDSFSLVKKASILIEKKQYARAETLARRVLGAYPGNSGALAVLCSALRHRGRPQQALDDTDRYKHKQFHELLTSRAAALCDLRRWEEAKKEIGRALAIGQSQEAFNVSNRIKSKRPDLYRVKRR
jgi:tetratricopeptide (TPR) repeat protein